MTERSSLRRWLTAASLSPPAAIKSGLPRPHGGPPSAPSPWRASASRRNRGAVARPPHAGRASSPCSARMPCPHPSAKATDGAVIGLLPGAVGGGIVRVEVRSLGRRDALAVARLVPVEHGVHRVLRLLEQVNPLPWRETTPAATCGLRGLEQTLRGDTLAVLQNWATHLIHDVAKSHRLRGIDLAVGDVQAGGLLRQLGQRHLVLERLLLDLLRVLLLGHRLPEPGLPHRGPLLDQTRGEANLLALRVLKLLEELKRLRRSPRRKLLERRQTSSVRLPHRGLERGLGLLRGAEVLGADHPGEAEGRSFPCAGDLLRREACPLGTPRRLPEQGQRACSYRQARRPA